MVSEGQQILLFVGGVLSLIFCIAVASCFISRNCRCESNIVEGFMEHIRSLPPEYRDSFLCDVDDSIAKRGYLLCGEVDDIRSEIQKIESELKLDRALTGKDE